MDRSKLKNIIVLILLALNLFLLAAVISDKSQAVHVRQQAWQSAVSALEGAGVAVSDGVDGRLCAFSPEGIRDGILWLMDHPEERARYAEAAGAKYRECADETERLLSLAEDGNRAAAGT